VKKSYRLFALAALFALGVACWSGMGSPAQEKKKAPFGVAPPPPLPRWEYKVTGLEKDDQAAEQALNKLGDEGWELVGTPSTVSASRAIEGSAAISTKVRLVFKRQKQ
jgi:hypothetical protein